ncbi:TonB-dependent receptor [Ideonella sp. A 288]|uniref:TonB-dependent receptor family protein n=1 Tax=Ideonella sp. A 288 TaxID=1962181 RepID=UPI000B4A98CE|nr:TonB-dependent receptor [Ideonella sp. A 288]
MTFSAPENVHALSSSAPLRPTVLALCIGCAAFGALAQSDAVSTVVVTGSVQGQRIVDAPFAISAVGADDLRNAGPMVNLSEALGRVPGLVVANRNNYAQDLQISSRGFGARATFGVRGLRLYSDGIPATGPDGQGQVAHFDLAGAQRVEVLRGPFSVLYGNSSGGVIAVFGAPARERRVELAGDVGSFGLHQVRGSLAAPLGGGFDLRVNLSAMELDGFRPQSAADRTLANVRLGWQGERDTVVLLVSDHNQKADDPLGLTPEAFAANPRQTAQVAIDFDTRKTIRQSQAGVNWRHRFDGAGPLRETSLSAYTGSRGVTQYLAIPATTQRSTIASSQRHGGGVVDFDRLYDGAEARVRLGWTGVDVTAGLVYDRQRDDRRGFENFTGAPTAPTAIGVLGNLRRDEANTATSRDAFVQAEWALSPAVSATAGVRSGRVEVSVNDRYVSGANLDDSGSLAYSYTNPVVGVRWKLQPQWTLHASMARGFESPTLGELAYTVNNSGVNFGLTGQTSRQFELGSKWRSGDVDVDAALFLVNTSNEIGVIANAGGRSVFKNVDSTRRYGGELSAIWRVSKALRAQVSVSALHAQYRNGYLTCTAVPCTTPNVRVAAGNVIAGTQRALGWAELAWKPGMLPGEWALELRGQAKTAANDTNQDFAHGFGLIHLRWSHDWPLGDAGTLQTLVRVDNLADRTHVGSVIVNDGNRRFFEPGAPRSALLSLRWNKAF